jgi:hypothetical protein
MLRIEESMAMYNMPYTDMVDLQDYRLADTPTTAHKVDKFMARRRNPFIRRIRTMVKKTTTPMPTETETSSEMEQQAKELFEKFIRNLWDLFPAPARHLVGDPLQEETLLNTFKIRNIRNVVRSPYFVPEGGNSYTWWERFKTFFDTERQLNMQGMQHWKNATYLAEYRSLRMALTAEEGERLDVALWRIFNEMESVPAAEKHGKIWKTRVPPGGDETSVYFAEKSRNNN